MQTKSTHPGSIDIVYVITKSNWGGAQRYVYECACHMHREHRVGVALGGNGMLVDELLKQNISVFPIESFTRDISFGKEILASIELFTLFRRERPDIVHLNSSKAGGLGALMARLAGVPHIIFTSHGLTFEEDRSWWQRQLIFFFTWFTFFLAHTVILISDANRASVARMPFVQKRLSVIHLGIPPIKTLSREKARKALLDKVKKDSFSRNTTWVGTIAELHPNKGLTYLIEAIQHVRQKHPHSLCCIIGEGEQRKKLEAMIEERGLTDAVLLIGFLPDAGTYLKAFDMVTLPSIKEGVPYTLLEAGSASVAFVGSALPGIREVVTDMESGILVQPKKPREIAGALTLLIEDPERRKKYAESLHARVTNDYSLRAMLEKTSNLYKKSLTL